jgi:hypothetical protein
MSSPPLRIELRRSHALQAALVLLAVLAAYALWQSQAPPWSLIAIPLLLASAWPRAEAPLAAALVLRDDGSVVLLATSGDEFGLDSLRMQRRGPLTVLTARRAGRRWAWVFTPEILSREARRRMTLWFERHAADAAPLRAQRSSGGAHV